MATSGLLFPFKFSKGVKFAKTLLSQKSVVKNPVILKKPDKSIKCIGAIKAEIEKYMALGPVYVLP